MREIDKRICADIMVALESDAFRHRLSERDTVYRENGGPVCYRLHSTTVAIITNKEVAINCQGWRSPTTKSRVNAILAHFCGGSSVFQKGFEWFVAIPHYGRGPGDLAFETRPYTDGLSFPRV